MEGGVVKEDMHLVIVALAGPDFLEKVAEGWAVEAVLSDHEGQQPMALANCCTNCQTGLGVRSVLNYDV